VEAEAACTLKAQRHNKENDVTANNLPEIPQAMRELAAKNIDGARAAYGQLMDAARKTHETMKTMTPPSPLAQGIHDVQERAMRFAQQNIEAGFSLVNELSQAADFTEMLKIQGSV